MQDLFKGDLKFHNVFHMEAKSWGDAGLIGWLVDGAYHHFPDEHAWRLIWTLCPGITEDLRGRSFSHMTW